MPGEYFSDEEMHADADAMDKTFDAAKAKNKQARRLEESADDRADNSGSRAETANYAIEADQLRAEAGQLRESMSDSGDAAAAETRAKQMAEAREAIAAAEMSHDEVSED